MHSTMKATLLLAATFVLGGMTGVFGAGAMRQRFDPPPGGRRPPPPGERRPGFVPQTLALLEPRDAAQREALLPYLTVTDDRNRTIVDSARSRMRAELDSLRVQIAPLLDTDQLERFDRFRRQSVGGPGLKPPGGPPPSRGGPPPLRPSPREGAGPSHD